MRKLQGLKSKVIKWPEDLEERYVVTVDGVDMKVWEPQHPTFPHDKKFFSKKFSHGAVKYELAVSIFSGDLVWIKGPFKAGVHDLTIFCHGLKNKLANGQIAIADRGYCSSKPDEIYKLATPYHTDSVELS